MAAGELETIYLTLADALELYASIIGGTTMAARNVLRSEAAL